MRSSALYKFWVENDYFDAETKKELLSIKDNPKEIEERFYKDLEFGTGGLRGIIGAGTNRINIYTVRKASQGLADYIKSLGLQDRGIAIAYDSRYKAFLFDELRPTPELSFTVRHLNAAAGVVITASHNPKEYNGYKKVISYINKIEDITQVKVMEKDEAIEKGLLRIIGKEIDDEYISKLKTLSVNPELAAEIGKTFKIVYTPLHGTGNKPVRRILDEIGFKNVLVVKEQELPDSEFSTVKSPNPEEREAFELAIELAKKEL